MNLKEIKDSYIDDGMGFDAATARTCRDVVLTLIAASPMASHATVKGGVVMQQVSGDVRRATRDVDLDFVRYPMTVEGIRAFLHALCQSGSGVALEVVGPIVDLKHQDYHGKRVNLRISDCNGMSMETKLDLGVHDSLALEQKELWFDTALCEAGVALMANSKEQMCAEKLCSLIRIGAASTRFKDVFDVYYLLCRVGVDAIAFDRAMRIMVYEAADMREDGRAAVHACLARVFGDKRFVRGLCRAHNNWLGANVAKVTSGILRYFE